MKKFLSLAVALTAGTLLAAPAEFKAIGDWSVEVTFNGKTSVVKAAPPIVKVVENERHDALQNFNGNAGGWGAGTRLDAVISMECSTYGGYQKGTLVVKSSDGADAVVYQNGVDYKLLEDWGALGRLPEGNIPENQPVFFDYAYCLHRIDSIVRDKAGEFVLRLGVPDSSTPVPPALQEGDVRLGNLWIKAGLQELTDEQLFPILETAFPDELRVAPGTAQKLLPKTLAKLQKGETLRILAWGDSVTVGTFLPDYLNHRWQEQFVAWLREQYPQADIQLETVAWGGRNTDSFLNEPAGSEYNYAEKVLGSKADLIISEFINDAWFPKEKTYQNYGKFLKDFAEIGAEWIILTPHYIRPDMMALTTEKGIDVDTREYVHAIRQFAAENGIAVADASLRWGRLWRQGIPYSSLMTNNINHPNIAGMTPFVEALKDIFR